MQEALANARKHARASRIDVLLESQDEGLRGVVADDGAGFDVAATLAQIRPGHLGLVAMRERAELAEGWLRIDSGGEGTAVAFWLPNKPDPRGDKPEPPLDEVARR